jgi:hypothetical protein
LANCDGARPDVAAIMALGLSDGGLSDGMVIKSEQIDGILPQG